MSNIPGALPLPLPTQANSTAFNARIAPLAGSQAVPLQLPPGARVVAEVVQSQTDGQVLLRLGQTLLAATLPGDHPVGEKLPLIVLSEPGAQPALLLAPPEAGPAAQAELSSTAQLLGRLQQEQPQAVRQSAPVWTAPGPAGSGQLAAALEQSVKSSGLFYESHLAAWVQGELPMPALLAEPQGKLSPLLAGAPQGAPASTSASAAPPPQATGLQSSAAQQVAASPTAPGAAHADPTRRGGGESGAATAAQATSTQASAADPALAARARQAVNAYASVQAPAPSPQTAMAELPAQLQALVQQQLATLAQGAVVWVGPVWPGQDMQWRIEPEQGRQSGGESGGEEPEAASRVWTSQIKLDLPRLGQLVVTLRLDAAQHVRIQVQHAAEAGALLAPQRGAFAQAMQTAGVQLDELALQASAS